MSSDNFTVIEGGLPPLIDRALELAKLYPVFPAKADKKPACKHGFLEASRDEETIRKLFDKREAKLLGVPTGEASGFFVLDVDPDGVAWLEANRERLPPTREHGTRRGAHLLFRQPPGKKVKSSTGAIATGIDIRGTGGYVIWWPQCGGQVLRDEPIAEPPDWLLEAANTARRRGADEPVQSGARNDAMISEAGRLRHYDVPESEAWDKLQALNSERCAPPLGDRELRKIFDSAWQYPPGYFNTDLGNADRLIDAHGASLRFVFQSKRWLHWNGVRFIEDNTHHAQRLMRVIARRMHLDAVAMPDGDARKAALRWATISEARDKIIAALALVPSYAGITIQQMELDADPWLLGTPGTIIDLRTGRPTPALQSQLITKSTRAVFDPAAACPLWLQCLEGWLPNAADRAFAKRFAGYCLTGLTIEQCLLLVFGESATGKTTFLETLERVWGDYAKRTPATTWLEKRGDSIPNDVAALAGCRMVVSTESERSASWAQSLLKAATGEETLSARFMRGEWFSFLPQFKPLFGTNYLPGYDGTDKAMTRRLRPLRFDQVVPREQRDKNLQRKLQEEGAGILRWALEGCLEWQTDGLGEPPSVIQAAREYAAANDPVASFIKECCEQDKAYDQQLAKPLHDAFVRYCKDQEQRPLSLNKFAEALTKRRFTNRHTKRGTCWEGIRLIPQPLPPEASPGGDPSPEAGPTDTLTPY